MIRYILIFSMLVIIAFRDFLPLDYDVIYYLDFFENSESLNFNLSDLNSFYVTYESYEHGHTYNFEAGFAYLNLFIYAISSSSFFYKLALGWPVLLIKFAVFKKYVFKCNSYFKHFLVLYFLWLFWYVDLNAVRAGISSSIIICTFICVICSNVNKFFACLYFTLAFLVGVSIHLSSLILLVLPIIYCLTVYLHSTSSNSSFSLIKLNAVYGYLTVIIILYFCSLLFKIDLIDFLLKTVDLNSELAEKLQFYSEENKNTHLRLVYSLINLCFSLWLAVVGGHKINMVLKIQLNNATIKKVLLFAYYCFLINLLFIALLNNYFITSKRLQEFFALFELVVAATVINSSKNKLSINNFIVYGYFLFVFLSLCINYLSKS